MQQLSPTKLIKAMLCIAIFSFTFSSCIKDEFQFDNLATTQWNPSLAIPIANSSLTLGDFIPEDDNLVTGPNNELTLVYESLYESPLASEIYPIPNQNTTQSVNFPGLPAGTPVDTGTIVIDTTMLLNFIAPPAMEIDSILFKSGQWNFNFSSSFSQSGSLQIIIRDAERNGVPFTSTIPFNYTGSTPVTTSASYGIGDYWFDLSRNGSSFNEIEVRYILTLINNGNAYAPSNAISIDQSISSINFREIHGYFGEQTITTDADTIDFKVFQNEFQYASMTLTNPSLSIDIRNSFGMPIEAQLSTFSVYSSQTGFSPISGPGLPSPVYVVGPDVSQMGQALLTEINLDNTNSNIATLLNTSPDAFLYNSNAFTNPDGRAGKNFIEENSQMTVNSTFELPLEGTFDKLVFNDTMDFTLESIDEIESITIVSNIENGFPLDFEVQYYFLDDNNNVLDSLSSQAITLIESAPVNQTTGLVTGTEKTKAEVVIPNNKVQNILGATKIYMYAATSTFQNGTVPVKIRSDYALDVKIGALVTLKMEF
ncbi:MAG: hypothetical protein HKN75_11715 [Bacteroidia bacterium]|nr:hypothetical protein [Bacteroidia bacterium]